MTERPFSDTNKPGRKDVNGVEWWACDPYPTWYRYPDGESLSNRPIIGPSAAWEDESPFGRFRFQTGIIVRTLNANADGYDEACESIKKFIESWNAIAEEITIEMPLMEPEQLNTIRKDGDE